MLKKKKKKKKGTKLVTAGFSKKVLISCCMFFSICTPAGAGIGFAVTGFGGSVEVYVAVFVSFAAGTFLYMALDELKETIDPKNSKAQIQLAVLVLGFTFMTILKIWV